MKASKLIEILQKNPDLEVKVIQVQEYEDDIPMLTITENYSIFPNEDGENELVLTAIHK